MFFFPWTWTTSHDISEVFEISGIFGIFGMATEPSHASLRPSEHALMLAAMGPHLGSENLSALFKSKSLQIRLQI